MKLDGIPAATVRRAVEIYLDQAYPGSSRWRAPKMDLSGSGTAENLVARFGDESEQQPDRLVRRYVLRLGNARYPHMKLVLEESILEDEYAFAVDTHDNLNVSQDAPDYDRWNQVRAHNRELADVIEQQWREGKVPTVSDIKELIGQVERIDAAGRDVLVVDDEPNIRAAIEKLLSHAGLNVRTAANGKEALKAVGERRPDLILMDYQMPEMDGVACCEALKKDPDTMLIPVLLATRSQVDLTELAYADGFLVKPYRQDVLFSIVRKLLG
ncbi:MAG: response regulator [Planctomycetota bacterium]